MLTPKQRNLLNFIHRYIQENGYGPSYDEMKDGMNLASKSGIHRIVHALKDRGFIRVLPNLARAIEIIRLPDSIAAAGSVTSS